MKDLLRISDLSREDLADLLALSEQIAIEPHASANLLDREIVICYFAKPSTRTRLSFSSAITRLGGTPAVVGAEELQLGRGETIEDTAQVISRYARAFVIRTFADEDVRRFARAATIPVVNALTDGHHPCQALADLLTLKRHFGHLDGLQVAYVGDGNNVAHSLMEACALAGIDIVVATPPGYEPDDDIVAGAAQIAKGSGSVVVTTNDPSRAVAHANAVYTDVWLSMGDSEAERQRRSEEFQPYQVDSALLSRAAKNAIFMHCLPAHRGQEVSADVIDGPRSVVFDQAENRMHTAQAVLIALVNGDLSGVEPDHADTLVPSEHFG